jgi:putative membrane protein
MKEDKPNNPSDHLANERTYLAWVRTSVGIMAFGFVVVKFTLFMKQISLILGKPLEPESKGYSSFLGIVLVCVGIFTALFSFLRYKHVERQLNGDNYKSSPLLITSLTVLILVVSILLVVYLLQSL